MLRGLQRKNRITDRVVSNVILIEVEITDFSFITRQANVALSKKLAQRDKVIDVRTGRKPSSDLGSIVNLDGLICIND